MAVSGSLFQKTPSQPPPVQLLAPKKRPANDIIILHVSMQLLAPKNDPQMKSIFFHVSAHFSKQLPNSHPYDYRHPYNHRKVHQNDPPNDSTFCILKLYIFPIESAFKYSHHSVTFSENRMSFSESQEVDDVIQGTFPWNESSDCYCYQVI